MHRYSGRKGNWIPYNYDEIVPRRHQWRDEMRPHVLDTAAALVAEVGPRRFTVKEVAERAGVGRTTVYKYFGLKAELLAACREHVAYTSGHRLDGKAAAHCRRPPQRGNTQGHPELARVQQVLVGLSGELQAEGDLWLLAAAEGVRSKRPPRHPRPWEPPSPFPSRLLGVVRRALLPAQAAGEVAKETDLAELARWSCALWWYALAVQGPKADGASAGRLEAGLDKALAWLLGGAGATHLRRPTAAAATCGQEAPTGSGSS